MVPAIVVLAYESGIVIVVVVAAAVVDDEFAQTQPSEGAPIVCSSSGSGAHSNPTIWV